MVALPRVSESLAGRMESLTLRPFAQVELLGRAMSSFAGIMLYTGEATLSFGERRYAVPMDALWEDLE